MNRNQLSQNIARYRKNAGLTQEELGNLLSVSMQAVSRWERGGAPDSALLPDLADALGVSIDDLFSYTNKKPLDLGALIRDEMGKTPQDQRLHKANDLACILFKSTVGAYDSQGDMLYRMAGLHDRVNRKQYSDPATVPTLINYDSDSGIMKSSVAKDYQYTLIMPEPEDGFAAVMKYCEEYRKLFELLAKPLRLQAMVFSYSGRRHSFTAAYMAQNLNISDALADEILNELSQYRLLQITKIDAPDGPLSTYFRRPGLNLIPFLAFAAELMQNPGQSILSFSTRQKALLQGALGDNGISPNWDTTPPQKTTHKNSLPPGEYGINEP